MGDGAAGSSIRTVGFDGLKDTGVLDAGKVVENFGFLAQSRVRGDRFAGQWNCPGRPQMFGEYKAQQTAFQAQQGDFGVLHTKNLGEDHTQIQRRNSLAQHRSQGEQVLGEYDFFFHHGVVVILGHR